MSKFVYTGQDNLEVMDMAVNYNGFLKHLATSNIPSKRALCLDFGAGSGTFADPLRADGYKNVECVEPDAALTKILKKRASKFIHRSTKWPIKA